MSEPEDPIVPRIKLSEVKMKVVRDPKLDPNATPTRLSKRLSKNAYILIFALPLLLGAAIGWGMYIRASRNSEVKVSASASNGDDSADQAGKNIVARAPYPNLAVAAATATPAPTSTPVAVAVPPLPELPVASPTPDAELQALISMKRQMFQAAIISPTMVIKAPPPALPTPTPLVLPAIPVTAGAGYAGITPSQTAGTPGGGMGGGLAGGSGLGPGAVSAANPYAMLSGVLGGQRLDNMSENSISRFAGNGSGEGDRWAPPGYMQVPRSRYELRAGFVIPGTLVSGINSDLPGEIVGQVTQDVFDTPLGRYLLIPKGTRIVGQYSSNQEFGQTRVLVAWQRLVFPDGKALDLGAMVGGDSAGFSGLHDLTYTHMTSALGAAVMMSAIVGGIAYAQNISNNGNNGGTYSGNNSQNLSSSMASALGNTLGQMMSQVLQKYLNVSPTQVIRPGYRFNIMVNKDLDFASPYVPFDYAPGLRPAVLNSVSSRSGLPLFINLSQHNVTGSGFGSLCYIN